MEDKINKRSINNSKRKTRFQSNGMQVLKIRKSKNVSLNLKMPSDIQQENHSSNDNKKK